MSHFCHKLLTFLLAFTLLWVPSARATSDTEARADCLVSLHVFQGTGFREDGSRIYDLDQRPSRLQGLIMLIRLLGLEDQALAYDGLCPFSDVTGRFAPLAAFAYDNGITKGTTETTFTPTQPLTPQAYITFLLRALGYTEASGDFVWGGQAALARSLGMMTEQAAASFESADMNRGQLVDLSYAALTCRVKDSGLTLAVKLSADGVFTWGEGVNAAVLGPDAGWTFDYSPAAAPVNSPAAPVNPAPPADASTVSHEKKTVSTSIGEVTAHVLTVNTANPAVTVKSAMVDKTLGHTAAFSSIVENSGGAVAVINGNFFNSYNPFKTPIGHVMVDGEFLYGNSGISSIGITDGGEVRVGRPPLFTRLRSGENEWSIYEINTADQDSTASVLYTPAYGASVTFRNGGSVLVVRNGVIRDFYTAAAGMDIAIPADGYLAFMGSGYTSTEYFRYPQIGASVNMEYYLFREDEEGFTLDGVTSIISGAPRLVKDGQIVTSLETGFTEERFTTASSPRTAIGVNGEGKLLLVCVPGGAKIQQMRELMLKLGCVDAFNLDGGASCGMYYNGTYISTPSRNLTVTLQVFVNG